MMMMSFYRIALVLVFVSRNNTALGDMHAAMSTEDGHEDAILDDLNGSTSNEVD